MKGLNPSKALGPMNILESLKNAVELGPVFARLFQQSLDKGEIPKEWSLANICPLYKKGNRALPSNCRPVSLTCVPCKMLEHKYVQILWLSLMNTNFCQTDNMLSGRTLAVKPQLVTVINDWAKDFGCRRSSRFIYIELREGL